MNLVRTSSTELSTTFSIKHQSKPRLAVLDISKILNPADLELPDHHDWYYFNRIQIPSTFIPQNASILLYQAMCEYADLRRINIYNEIIPYTNSLLNRRKLKKFESLFGFRSFKDLKYTTVRYCKPLD